MKLCSIEGCGQKHFAKRLCRKHYYRQPEWITYRRNWNRVWMIGYNKRPEVIAHRKAYLKALRGTVEYKKWRSEYTKNRKKTDIRFYIETNLRVLLQQALRKFGEGKTQSSKKYGISWDASVKKLVETKPVDFNERKFHIDHIKPLCSFDLTNSEQIKQAFAPENLQWLTAEENMRKNRFEVWE